MVLHKQFILIMKTYGYHFIVRNSPIMKGLILNLFCLIILSRLPFIYGWVETTKTVAKVSPLE